MADHHREPTHPTARKDHRCIAPACKPLGCSDCNCAVPADVYAALGRAFQDAERERFVTMLEHAMELDGFGCACEPARKCGTCQARDALKKALGPLRMDNGGSVMRSNVRLKRPAEGGSA